MNSPKLSSTMPKGTESILLVDDEEYVIVPLQQLLRILGYKVTAETDPIKALEIFSAEPDRFDLVITDMTMPKLTGDQLSLKMLAIKPQVPIIICTGYSDRLGNEQAQEIGIQCFKAKPLEIRDLSTLIRKILDKQSLDE